MAISSVGTFTTPCGGNPDRPLGNTHPQYTAFPVRPARIPTRSIHEPAHSFDFDSLALCLHSGRRHAYVNSWALLRLAGRPESRNLKDNDPVIVYLLAGGGCRDVDRNGEHRHCHQTTHHWWGGGVLVSLDLAKSRCEDYKPSLKFRYVENRRRGAIPSKSAARMSAE